tara:strand:- start:609 stop:842 length:234 start_codon:yes stop_codon:yes gene_type:complete
MLSPQKNLNMLLVQAHKEKNLSLLVELYSQASKATSDCDQACFWATQAYVLALEIDHSLSEQLFKFLLSNNREARRK